jgi:hypothetical protein
MRPITSLCDRPRALLVPLALSQAAVQPGALTCREPCSREHARKLRLPVGSIRRTWNRSPKAVVQGARHIFNPASHWPTLECLLTRMRLQW